MRSRLLKSILVLAVVGSLAGALGTQQILAQGSPPNPPSRFVGTVLVNGQPAANGTTVEAHIGSTVCGSTTVFISGSDARYTLDSPDTASVAGCGTDGATVTFFVGGQQAAQTGTWHNYQLNTVNLTVGGAATATATAAAPTPLAPVTGSGTASSGGMSRLFFFWLGGASLAAMGALTLAWYVGRPNRA